MNLIVREQYLESCPEHLAILLRERKPKELRMIISMNVSHFVKICEVLTILHQLICKGVANFGTRCMLKKYCSRKHKEMSVVVIEPEGCFHRCARFNKFVKTFVTSKRSHKWCTDHSTFNIEQQHSTG